MNNLGTFVALAEGGRLFGLDLQLLLDAAITAVNVFILFILLSYILYNPVRTMLKKRQDKITSDRETAESDKAEALALKKEYEEKLKAADKEAERVADEVKQQIISVAAVMASKFVAKAMDDQENDALIEQTLNEMGENTWLS